MHVILLFFCYGFCWDSDSNNWFKAMLSATCHREIPLTVKVNDTEKGLPAYEQLNTFTIAPMVKLK